MNWLSAIISGIISPITNAVTTVWTKKEDVSLEKFRVDGNVDTALVAAQVQIFQAQAELAKTKVMQFLYLVFALPVAIWFGKIYTWDAAFHLGTTDAVSGLGATYGTMIVGFIFFHSALSDWNRKT